MGGEEAVSALQAEEEIDSLADPFLKYPQGLADLVADSVFRNAQLTGDLLVSEPVALGHKENLAAFIRKGIYRRPQAGLSDGILLKILIIKKPGTESGHGTAAPSLCWARPSSPADISVSRMTDSGIPTPLIVLLLRIWSIQRFLTIE